MVSVCLEHYDNANSYLKPKNKRKKICGKMYFQITRREKRKGKGCPNVP